MAHPPTYPISLFLFIIPRWAWIGDPSLTPSMTRLESTCSGRTHDIIQLPPFHSISHPASHLVSCVSCPCPRARSDSFTGSPDFRLPTPSRRAPLASPLPPPRFGLFYSFISNLPPSLDLDQVLYHCLYLSSVYFYRLSLLYYAFALPSFSPLSRISHLTSRIPHPVFQTTSPPAVLAYSSSCIRMIPPCPLPRPPTRRVFLQCKWYSLDDRRWTDRSQPECKWTEDPRTAVACGSSTLCQSSMNVCSVRRIARNLAVRVSRIRNQPRTGTVHRYTRYHRWLR
jgi:hypothetical protein